MSAASPQDYRNLLWNATGFGVGAIATLFISFAVLLSWGTVGLGVFSQAYSAHILGTQIAVAGQGHSLLNRASLTKDTLPELYSEIASAFKIALASTALFCTLLYFGSSFIAEAFNSPDLQLALKFTALSIAFGSLIKLVVSLLAAREFLRGTAILQAFRPLVILGAVLVIAMSPATIAWVMAGVAAAEAATLGLGVCIAMKGLGTSSRNLAPKLCKVGQFERFRFGLLSIPSGILGQLNTRLDILVLGAFANDAVVGVFSFAAVLAEGFYLLGIMVRTVFSSRLVRMLSQPTSEAFDRFFSYWRWRTYFGALVIYLASVATYPLLISVLGLGDELLTGWGLYCVLAGGVLLCSGYIPFLSILMLSGRAGAHTAFIFALILFNISLNVVLTPIFGPMGTAAATVITYVSSVAGLCILSRRMLGLRIGFTS